MELPAFLYEPIPSSVSIPYDDLDTSPSDNGEKEAADIDADASPRQSVPHDTALFMRSDSDLTEKDWDSYHESGEGGVLEAQGVLEDDDSGEDAFAGLSAKARGKLPERWVQPLEAEGQAGADSLAQPVTEQGRDTEFVQRWLRDNRASMRSRLERAQARHVGFGRRVETEQRVEGTGRRAGVDLAGERHEDVPAGASEGGAERHAPSERPSEPEHVPAEWYTEPAQHTESEDAPPEWLGRLKLPEPQHLPTERHREHKETVTTLIQNRSREYSNRRDRMSPEPERQPGLEQLTAAQDNHAQPDDYHAQPEDNHRAQQSAEQLNRAAPTQPAEQSGKDPPDGSPSNTPMALDMTEQRLTEYYAEVYQHAAREGSTGPEGGLDPEHLSSRDREPEHSESAEPLEQNRDQARVHRVDGLVDDNLAGPSEVVMQQRTLSEQRREPDSPIVQGTRPAEETSTALDQHAPFKQDEPEIPWPDSTQPSDSEPPKGPENCHEGERPVENTPTALEQRALSKQDEGPLAGEAEIPWPDSTQPSDSESPKGPESRQLAADWAEVSDDDPEFGFAEWKKRNLPGQQVPELPSAPVPEKPSAPVLQKPSAPVPAKPKAPVPKPRPLPSSAEPKTPGAMQTSSTQKPAAAPGFPKKMLWSQVVRNAAVPQQQKAPTQTKVVLAPPTRQPKKDLEWRQEAQPPPPRSKGRDPPVGLTEKAQGKQPARGTPNRAQGAGAKAEGKGKGGLPARNAFGALEQLVGRGPASDESSAKDEWEAD